MYDRFIKNCSAKVFFEDCSDLKKFPVGTSWKTNPLQKFSSPVKLPSQQSSIDSLIENLLNHQMKDSGFQIVSGNDKVLAIFDDSCDDILESARFAYLATAGRHKDVSVIFIKHNLYQQGKYCVTVDKNTTHIVILKSPRIGRQLKILGSELQNAVSGFLEAAYQQATSIPFGHLLIDLTTTCHDSLRFWTRICNFDNSLRGRHNYSLTSQEAPPRKAGKFLKNISKTESLPHSRPIFTDELQLPTSLFLPKKVLFQYARPIAAEDHPNRNYHQYVKLRKDPPIIPFSTLSSTASTYKLLVKSLLTWLEQVLRAGSNFIIENTLQKLYEQLCWMNLCLFP